MNTQVVQTAQAIPVGRIGIFIDGYLESYLLTGKSKNTYDNYKLDIVQYCLFTFKKEPQFVTVEEIAQTKTIDASNFYVYLSYSLGLKGGSIKRKINAVRGLYKFLEADYPKVNHKIFNNLKVDDTDIESSGSLTWKEAKMIWEHAETSCGLDGKQMSMLIKTACITSFRLESLLELDWNIHFFVKNERGEDVNYIEVTLKRKKDKKPISKEFYKELRDKLTYDGKLFYSLHKHKVGRYLKKILQELGFDDRRNIRFHSFKGTGINRVLTKTGGNMKMAKIQGNHSSSSTTDKYYVAYEEDLRDLPSYTIDKEIDVDVDLSSFTREDFVEAFKKVSDSTKYELLRVLNEQSV